MNFKKRYEEDPEFRLQRLLILQRRNYRKQGGFPSARAYEYDIEKARREISERAATKGGDA